MSAKFIRVGTIEELKSKGRLVVRGSHRPILVVENQDRVYALDNRCPHMGFPLDRGSVEDGILTCHWHHARFDLASGCTFDLWADVRSRTARERSLDPDRFRAFRCRGVLAAAIRTGHGP